ncbi:disulfide bond formation protein B [Coxiella burnetii]|uniref:Probable disulfide formation protein n=1 Tax=Coxiella burnetii (strain CbuK_Q154) TaxID=434924 RepID=BDBC_COXB1|nr:disulfide bond formation protein B [Coxiella burnetii]B6J6V9.1 RecName: Full=Probable disulfide formation protein; AltName: Full=Disulfide oxidoreductase; AltName: Full=Thiol-disulfide oxidoreductase [Coxiella burnetii CbuK_Q154]ACJ20008.1 disulfide bond formation protein B [Coxiella burnetii CbuK_Q154]EAX33818.3 disulfide bond formation protein B [Coxiella burnetii 'MSU Goat Q177']UYK70487.1 disulfide bond formation protein B [Coxiella burnetii]
MMVFRLLKNYSLYFAWLTALIATLGSLYLSLVRHIPVCDLCWYQRVCIYPLTILLGIAAYRTDRGVVKYALPLVVLGFLFSIYQYLQQMIPGFAPINLCGSTSPHCSEIHWEIFGFITLPFLGMLATLIMSFFLIMAFYSLDKRLAN